MIQRLSNNHKGVFASLIFPAIVILSMMFTATVASAQNIAPVGLPTIDDTTPAEGQELRAITSSISDADGLVNSVFIYQWLANNNEISGATSETFTPMQAQVGQTISVRVSYTDDDGFDETLTSAATAAVVVVPPLIVTTMGTVVDSVDTTSIFIGGTAPAGSMITLSRAEGTFPVLTRTTNNDGFWSFADAPLIIGTNTFSITASNSAGQVSAPVVLIIVRGNGVPVGLPTIDDTTPTAGQTLNAITSGISDPNGLVRTMFSYQWLADGNEISGATSVTFTPMQAQIGQTHKCQSQLQR